MKTYIIVSANITDLGSQKCPHMIFSLTFMKRNAIFIFMSCFIALALNCNYGTSTKCKTGLQLKLIPGYFAEGYK